MQPGDRPPGDPGPRPRPGTGRRAPPAARAPHPALDLVTPALLDHRQRLAMGEHPTVCVDPDRLVGEVPVASGQQPGRGRLAATGGTHEGDHGTGRVGESGRMQHEELIGAGVDGPDRHRGGQALGEFVERGSPHLHALTRDLAAGLAVGCARSLGLGLALGRTTRVRPSADPGDERDQGPRLPRTLKRPVPGRRHLSGVRGRQVLQGEIEADAEHAQGQHAGSRSAPERVIGSAGFDAHSAHGPTVGGRPRPRTPARVAV